MILPFHRGGRDTFLQSAIYQTPPVDCPEGSSDFYNAVIEMEWDGSPSALLELTSSIEYFFGRQVSIIRNMPRPMDLDILYVGEESCDNEDLVLPHPRMAQRAFVLRPLADIIPEKRIPGLNFSPIQLLKDVEDDVASIRQVTRDW